MVRSKTLGRSAWWSESRWPEPGVFTISTSSPWSRKKPSSRATSSGRSWIAFIIEALTVFMDLILALLRRLDAAEGGEQHEVVEDLQAAAQQQRPGLQPGGEERAGEGRARGGRQAARYRGDAGGRGTFGLRNDRHHVGRARRHVHLRKRRAY